MPMSSNPDDSFINAANRWAWQLDDPEHTGQFRPIPRQGVWYNIGGLAYNVADVSAFVQHPLPPKPLPGRWRWTKPRIIEPEPPKRIERLRQTKMLEWMKLVPKEVAQRQVKWEIWHWIAAAHKAGVSIKALTAWTGLSHTMIYHGMHWHTRDALSPVARYTHLRRSELQEMARGMAAKVKAPRPKWADDCGWAHGE